MNSVFTPVQQFLITWLLVLVTGWFTLTAVSYVGELVSILVTAGLIAFLIGFYFVQANFRKQLVQVRKRWSLLLLYLAVALFVPFINATHTFEYWILTAIPLSAYAGCAFLYPAKRWLPAVLHLLMLVVVIVISYGLK